MVAGSIPAGRAFERGCLFGVNGGVVEGFWLLNGEGGAGHVVLLEEAALIAGVACAAGLLDLEEQDVLVAVGVPAFDFLGVSAGFALEPEFFAGAAPVVHEAGGEGFFQRFAVHPGEHEDAATGDVTRGGFLDDGGDEAVGGKFEVEFHSCRIKVSRVIGNYT